jgi:hypothetical protein
VRLARDRHEGLSFHGHVDADTCWRRRSCIGREKRRLSFARRAILVPIAIELVRDAETSLTWSKVEIYQCRQ